VVFKSGILVESKQRTQSNGTQKFAILKLPDNFADLQLEKTSIFKKHIFSELRNFTKKTSN